MKIKFYIAEVDAGYARPVFSGVDKSAVVAEIAEVCRQTWNDHDWGHEDVTGVADPSPPPIPTDNQKVLDTYFWAGDQGNIDTDGPKLFWTEFDVNLAMPLDTMIDLSVDISPFTAMRRSESSAVVQGELIAGGGMVSDALEGFVLALTSAGFPVHAPEFLECLKGYCEHLAARIVGADNTGLDPTRSFDSAKDVVAYCAGWPDPHAAVRAFVMYNLEMEERAFAVELIAESESLYFPKPGNTNCLEGFRCPKCQHTESFHIHGSVTLRVTDEGSEAIGNHEWYEDDNCYCCQCGHTAKVKAFKESS